MRNPHYKGTSMQDMRFHPSWGQKLHRCGVTGSMCAKRWDTFLEKVNRTLKSKKFKVIQREVRDWGKVVCQCYCKNKTKQCSKVLSHPEKTKQKMRLLGSYLLWSKARGHPGVLLQCTARIVIWGGTSLTTEGQFAHFGLHLQRHNNKVKTLISQSKDIQ